MKKREGKRELPFYEAIPEPLRDPKEREVVPGLISFIIPTYNEEKTIEGLLRTLEPLRKGGAEIIFSDGGSRDRTLELIPKDRGYRVIRAEKKGRAAQMNEGACSSRGEYLFFLHCDSELPEGAEEELRKVLSRYEAGCFGIDFREKKNLFKYTCKWISNHRVKDRKVMFGDQGIFLTRELFFKAGGYREIPIMEDYQLSLTLKAMGVPLGMTKHRIYTSPRRFQGNTFQKLRTMWQMNRLRAAYRKGVSPEVLAKRYRDIR